MRENPNLSFQSIQAALAASISGDTIVIRPGVYNEANLILKDQVDLFFELGAKIVYVGTGYIFLDNSLPINSTISGFGEFDVSDGLLLTTGVSTISFQGDTFQSTGTNPMFYQNSESNLQIEGDKFTTQNDVALLRCSSFGFTTTFNANAVNCILTRFLFVDEDSSGNINVTCQKLFCGNETNGSFELRSSFVVLAVQVETFACDNAQSYCINLQPNTPGSLQVSFKILDAIITGGLLNSVVTDPNVTRVVIDIDRLESRTFFLFNPISITNTTLDMHTGFWRYAAANDLPLFEAITSNVRFKGDNLQSNESPTFPGHIGFSIVNGGILQTNIMSATLSNYVIQNTTIPTTIVFICDRLLLTPLSNQNLFHFMGTTNIDIKNLNVTSQSSTGINTNGVFKMVGSEKVMIEIASFLYTIESIDIFQTAVNTKTNIILGTIENTQNTTTRLFNNSGDLTFTCQDIRMMLGGNIYYGQLNSISLCSIGNVTFYSPGNMIELQNSSTLNLSIQSSTVLINTNASALTMLRIRDASKLDANINSLIFNGHPDNFVGYLVHQTESSILELISNSITAINCETVFLSAGSTFNLDVTSLICRDGIANVFDLQNVNATLHIISANVLLTRQSFNNAFIHTSINALLNLTAHRVIVNATNQNATCYGLFIEDNSRMYGDVNYFDCDGQMLYASTSTFIFYNTIRSTANRECVVFSPFQGTGGQYTLGGYFSCGTAAAAVIYYDNPDPATMRLLDTTLVSLGSMPSIFSASALTVSLRPSSATNAVSGPITLVPAAAFFVDPGVF